MCLEKIIHCNLPSHKEVVTAYKVFEVKYNKILPMFNYGGSSDEDRSIAICGEYYKVNKWYKNQNYSLLYINNSTRYRSGYHAFKSLDALMKKTYLCRLGRIYEVSLRHITNIGLDYDATCYVAQEMKIDRRIK
jgi:hypothetical protein